VYPRRKRTSVRVYEYTPLVCYGPKPLTPRRHGGDEGASNRVAAGSAPASPPGQSRSNPGLVITKKRGRVRSLPRPADLDNPQARPARRAPAAAADRAATARRAPVLLPDPARYRSWSHATRVEMIERAFERQQRRGCHDPENRPKLFGRQRRDPAQQLRT